LDTKSINKSIENNLNDFYFSFKKGIDVEFYENEFLKSIHTSWPSFVLLNDDDIPFEKVINSFNKGEKLSKNWILNDNYVKNNQKSIKDEKLFPLKSWENMHLFRDKLINVKSISHFKVEKLQIEDLEEFIKIINASVFHKNVLEVTTVKQIINHSNFDFYVGKYKNKLVSTCLIFNNGLTSGLYFIATKDIFRGKGFAKNTVSMALNNQIKNKKYNFVLHATKLGKGIYTSLGFKAYGKLIIFVKI
jgi:hypothetical protein